MSDDDQLRQLLNDAVSDVEPDDRIEELRASVRARSRVPRLIHTRPWYAAAGIVAAVIGVVAFVTSVAGNDPDEAAPAGQGGTPGATATATDTAMISPSPSGSTQAYAVYYVGRDPRGKPVLFREFHDGPSSASAGALAVQGLQSDPLDPDYTTPWHPGYLRDAKPNPTAGVIFVTPGATVPQDRPAGMTAAYARAAVQQVVYTVQAAFKTRLPVQFIRHGQPVDRVLGITTSDPIAQAKVLDTLSHISISNPNQGDVVSGRLRVTGVNNGFEGTVAVYLERNGHRFATHATIGGTVEDRLFPWDITLELAEIPPGTYTLVAQNDVASGRDKPETDTRVITVE